MTLRVPLAPGQVTTRTVSFPLEECGVVADIDAVFDLARCDLFGDQLQRCAAVPVVEWGALEICPQSQESQSIASTNRWRRCQC